MSDVKKLKEPIECERFQVNNGVVVVLESKTKVKSGIVTDISRGGLSFRYLNHWKDQEWSSHELKISWNTKEFFIDSVPCEISSDRPLSTSESYSRLPMKICSVTFGEMPPEQMSKVEHFIKNFTKGPMSEQQPE